MSIFKYAKSIKVNGEPMNIPRILLTAGASGSGKTLITCGILQALVNRNMKVASFKCGPDYIDPMFHSRVIGTKSRNLDTFFTGEEVTRFLLASNAKDFDIAVMEGVMGYYDGVAGITSKASAYDVACVTDTPVILIVNAKGMSVSIVPYIKGFLEYKENSHIKGVIFNQMSAMLYPRMKELVETELGIKVYGYVPKVEDCIIESRHLGLVLPEEIPELKENLDRLSHILEKTLEIDEIIKTACEASEFEILQDTSISSLAHINNDFDFKLETHVKIAVADDEAFCFFYEDNLRLLREMGAELIHFSPIHDKSFPTDADGLLLYGGYPELNGKLLESNETMRDSMRQKLLEGMPLMAECGGFMYLHEEMEDMDGIRRNMLGIIPGKVYKTNRLSRFGYISLQSSNSVFDYDDFGSIPAHEFHYFDSENCGEDFRAEKPLSSRGWNCIHGSKTIMAGFPHLYYFGNPSVPKAFLTKCLEYKKGTVNK